MRKHGRWTDTALNDLLGRPFVVGDSVAKACTSGRAVNIEIGRVTRIEDGKMYLDHSKVPINYPGRILIVNKEVSHEEDPLG